MPSSDTMPLDRDEEEEESESTSLSGSPFPRRVSPLVRPSSVGKRPDSRLSNAGTSSTVNSRPNSVVGQARPQSVQGMGRAKSLTRLNGLNGAGGKLTGLQRSAVVSNLCLFV